MSWARIGARDYITRAVSVAYDPAAQAPRWSQFLREIFEDKEELIEFVRRAVGYSLTGDVRARNACSSPGAAAPTASPSS